MSEGTSGETLVLKTGLQSNVGSLEVTNEDVEMFPGGRVIGGPLSEEFNATQQFKRRMSGNE